MLQRHALRDSMCKANGRTAGQPTGWPAVLLAHWIGNRLPPRESRFAREPVILGTAYRPDWSGRMSRGCGFSSAPNAPVGLRAGRSQTLLSFPVPETLDIANRHAGIPKGTPSRQTNQNKQAHPIKSRIRRFLF